MNTGLAVASSICIRWVGFASLANVTLFLTACADVGPDEVPTSPVATLELEFAALGLEPACVELALGDFEPEQVCTTPVDGRATILAQTACNPTFGSVRATFWLTPLHDTALDAFYDPCGDKGCALDLDCGTGTTHARLELAFLSGREFSPVSVATSSAWFYAQASTCRRIDGADSSLLLNWGDGPRPTGLINYNTARLGVTPAILASTPVIACGEVTCRLPHTSDDISSAGCSDGSRVRYRYFLGDSQDTVPSRYVSVAIDLDSLAATGLVGCQLNAAATFAEVDNHPFDLGRADAFPVARYHLPLIDSDGEFVCAHATLDRYDVVDDEIMTVEYLRGWNLRPLGELGLALPPLCQKIDERGLTSTCP